MSLQAIPARYRVTSRSAETYDTVTLGLEPVDQPIASHQPGQFTMLYAFGIGEVPISVSGGPAGAGLVQTIRSVGAVTRALCEAGEGQLIGVRGLFATGWGVADAAGQDLMVVAGGIGLAPLRGALLAALASRERYRRVTLLIGCSPASCKPGWSAAPTCRSPSTGPRPAGAATWAWSPSWSTGWTSTRPRPWPWSAGPR
jgi:NAD(P)H-flavin reductase